MKFRKSLKSDINKIMNIINQAQEYFKENNIDQWQNNYPNPEIINADIDNGYSYVVINDNDIVATAAVSFDSENTYNKIYDGEWLSNGEYAVIHRIAVKSNKKGYGISSLIIRNVEELCLKKSVYSIKIDTHKDNISMKKLLEKNGFKYCGIIYLEAGSERIAFEKVIRGN